MGRRTRTSFKPGQSGNPRGRPPGVREALPRGLLRRLVMAAIEGQERAVVDMIQCCLKKPGPFLKMLELAAKLNKEIGADAEAQAPGFTLVFESPLRPDDLRQGIQNRDR